MQKLFDFVDNGSCSLLYAGRVIIDDRNHAKVRRQVREVSQAEVLVDGSADVESD